MTLDFNTAPRQLQPVDPAAWDARLERLRDALRGRAREIVSEVFPMARLQGAEARIGSVRGEAGESLSIGLGGERAGLWHDHATGEGGDLIDLWRATQGGEFPQAVTELEDYLGLGSSRPRFATVVGRVADARQRKAKSEPRPDAALPPPSASWHYLAADGATVLAIVRRYDLDAVDERTGKRKKTFRPFRADGSAGMPDPRPLYGLPAIATASEVILVEGEKCADALGTVGVTATTQMGGAKADTAKTDWRPLAGKAVAVWEDNDASGEGLYDRVRGALEAIGCTVRRIAPPAGKPPSWDAANAVDEGLDIQAIIAAPTAEPRQRFRFLTLAQLRDLKPPEWRIDGVLPVHGSSVIYGAYESFKTFVALDKLLSLAAGRDWQGQATKPCGILYVAGEGQHGLASRTTGWLAAREISPDLPFLVLPEAVAIPAAGDIDDLCRAIDAMPFTPGIIALDTLTRMSGGGSLNDEKDMQAYVRGMDLLRTRTGAHILNVGHSGKNQEKGLMGSVVLPGAVETIICVERKGDAVTLINQGPKGKQKDGPNFEDIRLVTRKVEFDQGGVRGSTLVLQKDVDPVAPASAGAAVEPARRLGPLQTKIMAALEQAGRSSQTLDFMRLKLMTGCDDHGTLGKSLRTMARDGLIVNAGNDERQAWRLP